MKSYILIPVIIVSVAVSWFIWTSSPDYIKQGGPLLVLGLTLFFLVVTYALERGITLWRAGGRGNVPRFVSNVKQALDSGDIPAAIEITRRQGGSLANVVGAGLERYRSMRAKGTDEPQVLEQVRRTLAEASALESPLLERNLSALSTIASIATLVGLLGTTIGMIRAFRAMAHAGAPDATQLAVGISEALVNTALGLMTAILGIVLHNYFTSKVDNFNDDLEETSYAVIRLLEQEPEA